MLVQIEYQTNPYFEEFLRGVQNKELRYYASDLQAALELSHISELADAVKRAMRACQSQQLSIDDHFKAIYRCQEHDLILDWKLSGLGYSMVLLNSDPAYPLVAQMQLELIRRSTWSG